MQTGLLKRFAAVLLVSSSLTFVSLESAQADDDWDLYVSSGYVYCDAKLIADLWGISVEDAKVQIGQKIRNGIGGNIPSVLRLSRQNGNECEWADTGYSYEDAERLAQLWATDTIEDAKYKVARYMTNGQRAIVERALRAAS